MISYQPLFDTMKKQNITEYNLIYKQGLSANTIHRIKKGLPITLRIGITCIAIYPVSQKVTIVTAVTAFPI